jgi:hypothetical protein
VEQANTPQHFSVKGRVIEIFQKEGKPVTRVSVDSFYLDLPAGSLSDAHLKDTVVIEGTMTIADVRNDFTATLSEAKS